MSVISFLLISILIFVIQIVVFLRCKRTAIRLLPLGLCLLITISLFAVGMIVQDGWTGAGLWIFGILSLLFTAVCGVGLLIALLIRKVQH